MSDAPVTLSTLAKFHREIVLPDIERVVGAVEQRLRDEMHGLFDALAQRLDRLETEYHMIVAGLQRLEERMERLEHRMDGLEHRMEGLDQRMGRVEERFDKVALRSELVQLKSRVDGLQETIRQMEARLDE